MKTRLLLPCIMLGIGLSSFTLNGSPSTRNQTVQNQSVDYCAIYMATSVIRNGEEIGDNFMNTLFYFCSNQLFSANTGISVYEGTWMMDEKMGILVISAGVPENLDWINGTWQVIAQTEDVTEMLREENGVSWKVRLEKRQR